MRSFFPRLAVALFLIGLWTGPAWGQVDPGFAPDTTARPFDPAYDQPPPASTPAAPEGDSRVSLFHDPDGKLVLVVDYPWTINLRPSVEIRLLGEGEPDDQKIQPMYFRWKYMKGNTTIAVYRCQDRCENYPVSASVTELGETFDVLGDRNALGAPAVCVARLTERRQTGRKGQAKAKPGSAAAFPLLEPWSMSKNRLYFDLPPSYFASPGRMKVWFLRDDRVMWMEAIDWPGAGQANTKGAAAATTPAPSARPKPQPVAVPKAGS